MEIIPVIIYAFFISFILFYSMIEFHLVIRYIISHFKKKKFKTYSSTDSSLPFVTIQLPVYNEMYVAERLLDAIVKLDYPMEKLEIQLLDDSEDETSAILEKKIADLSQQGFQFVHIRRKERVGYKAGALAHGLQTCKGEYVAIFDADFLPPADFLLKTLPFFENEKTGCVQSRWGHVNKNYSLITRLQAFALDAHFTVEQTGRYTSNSFLNFNGTAGIWRKTCIVDSGNWQADTLTEDLDLSYRAQLKNWKIHYIEELECKAELPAEMNALKLQQFRWSKGAAECTRKNLSNVLASKQSINKKLHAFFHLLNSFLYICILCMGLLSLPVIYIMREYGDYSSFYSLFVIFYAGIGFITLQYFTSEISVAKNKLAGILEFLALFPVFLSISMGLSLFNGIGVIEGYIGKKSPFIRTPKFNIVNRNESWHGNRYITQHIAPVTWFEGLLFLFFGFCTWKVIEWESYLSLPFFAMLSFGFGFVFISSVYHIFKK
ncbi:MAG: cellulose synthase family protein [Flavobacteriales bacterium]